MTVSAYAKVNFTLEVGGLRADGYHALRSVVMPVSLCDTLDVEPADDGRIASDAGFPDDLCVKAADVLRRACGSSGGRAANGARISVTKRIPAGGGLGGGSADAAAVLLALNDLWQLGMTAAELARIGAQVGSDVPALVLAQHDRAPVLMEGRGERVTSLSGLRSPTFDLLLVNPGVFSSTKEVYAACTPRAAGGVPATDEMVAALGAGDFGRVCAALRNDLQDPAVRLHPEIAGALSALRAAGAAAALMTGSGSCAFGLFPDAARADAAAVALAADGRGVFRLTAPERPQVGIICGKAP